MTEAKGSDVREAIEECVGRIELRGKGVWERQIWECVEEVPNELKWVNRGTLQEHLEARVQAAIKDEKQNLWKQAIIEALIVDCILSKANENDPKKALNDLICWNNKVTLDPQVSHEAAALVQAAAVEMREECATITDEESSAYKAGCRVRSLPIPTSALDAALLRARINEHDRGCIVPLCPSEPCGRRRELMRQLAALTRPTPEKEPRRWTR